MRKTTALILLAVLPLLLAGCDEKKTIQSIRTGQTMAATLAASTYTALTVAHQSGQITDAQWQKFQAVWDRYKTANQLLGTAIAAWDAGIGKPTVERLLALLDSLNAIITDINALIDAWHIKTAQVPIVRGRA